MLFLYRTVFLLFYVVIASNGSIVLGVWQKTSIDCASNAELTFQFISNKTKQTLAIAECDPMMKSCQLLETPLENKFNISYTGRGGILSIISLEEDTFGTYKCCETYNPSNFVSIDISQSRNNFTTNNSSKKVHETTTTITLNPLTGNILLGFTTCISLTLAIILIIDKCYCPKGNKRVKQPMDRDDHIDEENTALLAERNNIETSKAQISNAGYFLEQVQETEQTSSVVVKTVALVSSNETSNKEKKMTVVRNDGTIADETRIMKAWKSSIVELSGQVNKVLIGHLSVVRGELRKMRKAIKAVESLLNKVTGHNKTTRGGTDEETSTNAVAIRDTHAIERKANTERMMADVHCFFKKVEFLRWRIMEKLNFEPERNMMRQWPDSEIRAIRYLEQ